MGASGVVFSPSCDASHLRPAPLQQHQAAQGRPSQHSSSAAGALLFARADRLLLGSDLPRGSLGAAPALGRLGPRPAGGLRPSTHSRLLGDSRAAAQTGVAPAGLIAGSSAAASCPSISTTGSVDFRSVVVLQPGIQQVAFCHPVAQLSSGVQQLMAAVAMAEGLLERLAGFCISHQALQIRPAHARAPGMCSRSRELVAGTRFRRARCCTPPDCFLPFIGMEVRSSWVNQTSSDLTGAAGPRLDRRGASRSVHKAR